MSVVLYSDYAPSRVKLAQGQRYIDDSDLAVHIEQLFGLKCRGQLVPTNLSTQNYPNQQNHLYKCQQCPTFSPRKENHSRCIASPNCCTQYYLVFQTQPERSTEVRLSTCCTNEAVQCADKSMWFAVDPFISVDAFDSSKHLLPLQIEQSHVLADVLNHRCAECRCHTSKFSGSAQWKSCATCCGLSDRTVDTDLYRDSLVRIGATGTKYWQYKPLARTEADRVHGIYGQSVFRGHGPCHYLPDYRRRYTPVRGGYVPANIAPRAVSAVMAPRLCDSSGCRTALY